MDEFLRTCYLGCEHCYAEFSAEIEQFVESYQRGVTHEGKFPLSEQAFSKDGYEYLIKELERAIADDDFVRVSKIKAQMKKMQTEGER